jgi:hypothetical protein
LALGTLRKGLRPAPGGRYRRRVPGIEVIPFTPGRRPTDEARHPWLGSSDEVAFQLGDGTENRCYVLQLHQPPAAAAGERRSSRNNFSA